MIENPDLVKKYGIDEKRNLAPCGGGFGPVRMTYSSYSISFAYVLCSQTIGNY